MEVTKFFFHALKLAKIEIFSVRKLEFLGNLGPTWKVAGATIIFLSIRVDWKRNGFLNAFVVVQMFNSTNAANETKEKKGASKNGHAVTNL